MFYRFQGSVQNASQDSLSISQEFEDPGMAVRQDPKFEIILFRVLCIHTNHKVIKLINLLLNFFPFLLYLHCFLFSQTPCLFLLLSLTPSLGLDNWDHWLKVKSGTKEIFMALSDGVGKNSYLFSQRLLFKLKCILCMNFQVKSYLASFIRM